MNLYAPPEGQFLGTAEELEAAADEARRAHDLGAALQLYREAFAVASSGAGEDDAARVRILEGAAITARHTPDPGQVLPLIHEALRGRLTPSHRGRLLFAEGLVLGYSGDLTRRVALLQRARAAFEEGADDVGAARALGALAIPIGTALTIDERIQLGEAGLAAARRAADEAAFAHCEGNLAGAYAAGGDVRAFDAWQRSVGALEASASPLLRDDAVRYRSQWASGSLAWGRYDETANLIAEGRARTTHPFWLRRFALHEAILAWRTGRFDDALAAANQAIEGTPLRMMAGARAIISAIEFERSPRGSAQPLDLDLEPDALNPGALSLAIAVEISVARREPNPARGVLAFASTAARMRVSVGWEDLLPAAAAADPPVGEQVRSLTDLVPLVGPRAQACVHAARALLAEGHDPAEAATHALTAASELERLSEPYAQARCLEVAARALARSGRTAGVERRRAAEIFDRLGAERSLARLLRASGRTRALASFRVPRSQRHGASPGLTMRETEVARLAAQAFTAKEIAARLGVSVATVRTHLANIKRALGVARKADLVRLFRDDARPG